MADALALDGAEAGRLADAHDWPTSPLGPVEGWPGPLSMAVDLMLGSAEAMYLVWGPELTFLCNDAYRRALGSPVEARMGRPFPSASPEAWTAMRGHLERAFAGEAGRFVDVPVSMARHGRDETTWWTYSLTPVRDRDAVAGVLCIVTETTEKVRGDRRADFLIGLSDALRASDGAADLVATSCEMLGRYLDAERCGFAEVDAEGVTFSIERDWTNGVMPSFAGVMRMDDFGREAVDELRAGRSLRIEDAFADRRTEDSAERYREAGSLRSALCVPLVVDGAFIAAVFVNQTKPRWWTDDEEILVRQVAGRVFSGMQRARAETALASALATTRDSQARLSLAVDIARLGTFEWDTVGGSVEMDGKSREIFGLATQGPVHQDEVFSRLAKIDVERAHALTAAAGADGTEVVADYRVTRPDGTTRTILSSSEPVKDDGGPLRMIGVFHDVTVLRQAEADLRALNADLERRVIEHTRARGRTWALTPDLMGALNGRGYFETSNPAWRTVLGWSEAEVAGTPVWDLLHPDDVEHTHASFEMTLQGQPSVGTANRYRCKDGSYRWISWIGVPEDGLVYCTGRDITAEKRREAELAARTAERDLLATIVESTDVMVMACDLDYGILAINKANADEFERAYGVRPKVGDDMLALLADRPEQAEQVRLGWARGLAGEETTFVEEHGDPGHTRPYYEIKFRTLRDERGERIGCYQFVTDVTERLREQAKLAEAQEQLRQSQKLEAVGQLTGGVAHDFNNLLTVIKSSTDLLKRPDLAEERRVRYIGAISDTVDRAAKLTGQLLAFARRQALRPEVFDVGRSVRAIGEMVGTLTGARIALSIHVDDEACHVSADPSQFDTALVNMTVNARDAMDGEGRLDIVVGVVDVVPAMRSHPAQVGDFVRIELTDTGSGIPEDQVDRIFEPFFTTKGVGQGTGLGLSQVFGFAKQSGGEIQVRSEVGRGTTFALYLPRVEAMAGEKEEPSFDLVTDGRGARVLVVEDNRDVGTFSTQTLQELGYGTHWVANADEALAALAESPDAFDVVFSDVVMPGMNGVELGRAVSRLYPGLPVVLTSGYSHVLAQESDHGFEILHKPYSVEALSRILRRAASKPRRRRRPAVE